MDIRKISPGLSVAPQINIQDLGVLAGKGYRGIVNNRPDFEDDEQPSSEEIKQVATELGLAYRHLPVVAGQIADSDISGFKAAMDEMEGPLLAYCRTGTRAATLWALTEAGHLSTDAILATAEDAGYDLKGLIGRLDKTANARRAGSAKARPEQASHTIHDVVVVGGGAGGLAAVASLLKRRPNLDIAVIEPRDVHYYQPGWTLVGGGVFSREQTKRAMKDVIPSKAKWIRAAVAEFHPERNAVTLEDGEDVLYKSLVVAPGIKLNWDGIAGLKDTLGKNGVTSNYRFDLASYTWELVKGLKHGKAIFTQPPMPIKCAGAPQKAMYLACDQWQRTGRLSDILVEFHTSTPTLFGVADYVPELMKYIDGYGAKLFFEETLVAVDSDKKIATFEVKKEDGETIRMERQFDMIHVCPPQTPLDFMKCTPIADAAGWVEVNSETLQHVKYGNIFGLGDGCSAPNAKTAAAVRKQAPVVAHNLISVLEGGATGALYTGYGSCPLTVERGKVVLAEFGYGGTLEPTFPSWVLNGTKASGLSWLLKEKFMPALYFDMMLKGREWLAKPEVISHAPLSHEVVDACDYSGK